MAKDTPDQSRPGAPRREPSRFEPPPWEKERFDELAQERRERDEASVDAAAVAAALKAVPGASATSAPPTRAGTEEIVAEADLPVASAELEEMFQELSAEEGDGLGSTAENVRLGIGAALLILGVVFAFVAMRLLSTSFEAGGPAALIGSTIVGFMGLALAGAGLYLTVRSLRERGVM